MIEPYICERYADNGALTHYDVVNKNTGEILWQPDESVCEESVQLDTDVSLPDDVKNFIYHVTLYLQTNVHPEKQRTAMFNNAYKLYTKYDVEN